MRWDLLESASQFIGPDVVAKMFFPLGVFELILQIKSLQEH